MTNARMSKQSRKCHSDPAGAGEESWDLPDSGATDDHQLEMFRSAQHDKTSTSLAKGRGCAVDLV